MKNKKELPNLGKKGTVAGLVICFVAMITLVGTYTFSQYQENVENEIAELDLLEENEWIQEDVVLEEVVEEANGDQIINEEVILEETETTIIADASEDTSESVASESITNESVAEQATFSAESQLLWPVDGGIIMLFNMDEAVYFETLDQYKLNPAIIIEGTVGTEVLAAERGTVVEISYAADIGNTITIDMGNGYTAVYGQLDDLRVTEGSYVEKGQVIATLTEPTKYYSLEGCNLYFQLLLDGASIDPMDYLTD